MSDVPPTGPEREPEPRLEPLFPGAPGRKPFTKGQRKALAIALAVAGLGLVAATVVLATTSGDAPPPRAATTTAEEREAPPQLVQQAKDLGYTPQTQARVGIVEIQGAETAPAALSQNLLPVGTMAPDFALKTPGGRSVSLSDYRGKAVLLEFFATWCPHCAAEAPHLARLAKKLPASKVAFLGVNGNNEDAATVLAYHMHFALPFPSLLDPDPEDDPATYPDKGSPGPVSRSYGVGFYPTFYVIDPEGRISWRSDGEQPNELLERELERAAGA